MGTSVGSGAITALFGAWVMCRVARNPKPPSEDRFANVIGLATYGYKVIATIGKKITELTPSRGFAAELGTSCTVVLASGVGIPISTTHTLVGAVLGVGLARGIAALNLRVAGGILSSWVITLPAGAMLSILYFYLFKHLFS